MRIGFQPVLLIYEREGMMEWGREIAIILSLTIYCKFPFVTKT